MAAGRNPDQDGAPNPPYTYPDFNSLYLAAVRASDGAVLVPSFYRYGQNNQPISLRPSGAYHTGFPAPEDGVADVKNLPDSPGLLSPTTEQFTPNDSVWMDLGFPVMRGPDGRMFKPLFAALLQDLDGRVNVNMNGNILGDIGGSYYTSSHQGWSPGEVNLGKVLTGPNTEVGNLFISPLPNVNGRYDQTRWSNFWAGGGWGGRSNQELKDIYSPGGHFYFSTNLDTWPNGGGALVLPTATSGWGFPFLSGAYTHGWWGRNDDVFNPMLYNFFDPKQNCYWIGSPPPDGPNDRVFLPPIWRRCSATATAAPRP